MRVNRLGPQFIEHRPDALEEGTIYVSLTFRTSVHLCCCGCGNEIWLPIRPSRWKFTYDGETISLSPSVGNWSFPCQSHYWIRNSRVEWAPAWSAEQIEAGRERTRQRDQQPTIEVGEKRPWWRRLLDAMPWR